MSQYVETAALEELLRVLRKWDVEHFKDGETMITLRPGYATPPDMPKATNPDGTPVTDEDILFNPLAGMEGQDNG